MVRLSVLEHLRVVHGIKLKNCGRKKEKRFTGGTKVFGVPLESLPLCYMPQCGLLPCFLVDACEHLLEHAGTDGLFRKSGSVVRLRTLRAKLDHGEACLSTALPCDVASLLKLFCRELPDPLFPSDLHSALLKAQLLPTLEERALATQLLSCLLPDRNFAFLSYFFHFLSKVSHRCAENRMTNSNLAVVFVPSLLPPSHGTEGMDTYMKLKAVVYTFIENVHSFGVVPQVIMEGIPGHAEMSPCRKRRPLRKSLGLEAFPDIQLFRNKTFCSGKPGSSPSARLARSPSTPVRTESCRVQSKTLKRMDSGNVGCFSAKRLKGGDSIRRCQLLSEPGNSGRLINCGARIDCILVQHYRLLLLASRIHAMASAVRLRRTVLLIVLAGLASARSPRTVDQVSEADIQRLLHGVMEQLGIARPRVEYPAHQATNIVGPQSIQGGAHEGLQHLGPYGNIPNIVAELTGDNIPKDFSEDHGYPDPPNPCPVGKTDGCLENAPDTAEFSREFQKHQHLFDPEHDYPALAKWNKELLYQKLKGGAKRRKRSVNNPYLMGQRLNNVVAKKSVPHYPEEDEDYRTTTATKTTT
ncbi:uncharacterized protein LOC120019394 [Salvelinus namaycush]|uniref:Uncharacterized protein LOC120019394 n=1 Tax=Salvelinus namaycush TaxID=8040 RepID=A0A8U0TK57_SALNM|nr:uncharacterized protein LOC120019394 [Salvelinus namaycush]